MTSTSAATSPTATERCEEECGRPMRADARRNYERLLAAARTVLAERGREASMEEIAKTADVGVGTLYRHFPKRIDLIEAVYRTDIDGLVRLSETAAAEYEPWNGLVRWLQAFVSYAQSKRVLLTELHEAFEKNPDFVLSSRERLAAAARTVLVRAQQAGAARTDIDHSDLMQLIGGMCMARAATLAGNERLLVVVLDGIRARPAA